MKCNKTDRTNKYKVNTVCEKRSIGKFMSDLQRMPSKTWFLIASLLYSVSNIVKKCAIREYHTAIKRNIVSAFFPIAVKILKFVFIIINSNLIYSLEQDIEVIIYQATFLFNSVSGFPAYHLPIALYAYPVCNYVYYLLPLTLIWSKRTVIHRWKFYTYHYNNLVVCVFHLLLILLARKSFIH